MKRLINGQCNEITGVYLMSKTFFMNFMLMTTHQGLLNTGKVVVKLVEHSCTSIVVISHSRGWKCESYTEMCP